jgi:hypothetical protein
MNVGQSGHPCEPVISEGKPALSYPAILKIVVITASQTCANLKDILWSIFMIRSRNRFLVGVFAGIGAMFGLMALSLTSHESIMVMSWTVMSLGSLPVTKMILIDVH